MAVQKGKKARAKANAKRPAKKSAKKPAKKAKGGAFNRNAQWKTYRELQMQADRAWEKFRDDVRINAQSNILIRDNNQLLLLLGECNYMARECMRIAGKGKKKAR